MQKRKEQKGVGMCARMERLTDKFDVWFFLCAFVKTLIGVLILLLAEVD